MCGEAHLQIATTLSCNTAHFRPLLPASCFLQGNQLPHPQQEDDTAVGSETLKEHGLRVYHGERLAGTRAICRSPVLRDPVKEQPAAGLTCRAWGSSRAHMGGEAKAHNRGTLNPAWGSGRSSVAGARRPSHPSCLKDVKAVEYIMGALSPPRSGAAATRRVAGHLLPRTGVAQLARTFTFPKIAS